MNLKNKLVDMKAKKRQEREENYKARRAGELRGIQEKAYKKAAGLDTKTDKHDRDGMRAVDEFMAGFTRPSGISLKGVKNGRY